MQRKELTKHEGAAFTIPFISLSFRNSNKRKLLFSFASFREIHFMEWSWMKIYYNSMLKVISWYKLSSKSKIGDEFVSEMTFKPLAHQLLFLFFLNCSLRMDNSKKRRQLRALRPKGTLHQTKHEIYWLFWLVMCFPRSTRNLNLFGFSSLFFGWVMGCGSSHSSAQRREREEKTKWIQWRVKNESGMNQSNQLELFVFSFMEWNGMKKNKQWIDLDWWMEPGPLSFFNSTTNSIQGGWEEKSQPWIGVGLLVWVRERGPIEFSFVGYWRGPSPRQLAHKEDELAPQHSFIN